jgi:hypothetical protein
VFLDLFFFCAGAVFMAALLHLIGKEVMAKKNEVQWQERFTHADSEYMVQGRYLGGGSEKLIAGALKTEFNPQHGQAEIALINGTVLRIRKDDQLIWKKGDDIDDLPREYDRETKKTTGDRIMHLLVEQHPELADKYPETFGEYLEDEDSEDSDLEFPISAIDANSRPKPIHSLAEPTE